MIWISYLINEDIDNTGFNHHRGEQRTRSISNAFGATVNLNIPNVGNTTSR